MGRDKGLIPVGDALLYQFPLRVLESVCHTLLISTGKQLEIEEDHEQVRDTISGMGPIGGLYTCLNHSKTDLNLVVPYDLPLVNRELFLHLLKRVQGYEVVIAAMEPDKPEPLCGIYRKTVLPVIREMIREKNYAIHRLLPRVHSNIVLVDPSQPYFHEKLFSNVNSPADLERILPDLV
jgi:molybdopterin-guanine dinucleotide biosynthesis protein A